jgi:hypothetical protein
MWTLRRPEALLNFYEFNEDPVTLGHRIDASQFFEETDVLIPYRFGMDLHQVKHSLWLLDDDEIVFFVDHLELFNSQGESRILKVPRGIICKWFLKTIGNMGGRFGVRLSY